MNAGSGATKRRAVKFWRVKCSPELHQKWSSVKLERACKDINDQAAYVPNGNSPSSASKDAHASPPHKRRLRSVS